MTTNFALSLSFEGIELMHRVPRGWRLIGKADVEDPDLDKVLKTLHADALKLEPGGLRTKIVLPLDQIKYLAIDSTQTDMDDIQAALHNATPYALDELIIDYERFGGRTHIAAVARDTLEEAESFARAHGFRPVCFVAVPEPFTFQSEVFFGPTATMQEVLGVDGQVARDKLPVMQIGTRIKSRLLVFDTDEYDDDDSALPSPTPAGSGGFDLAELLAPYVAEEDAPATDAAPAPETAEPADDLAMPIPTEPDAQPELELAPVVAINPVQRPLFVDRIVPEYYAPIVAVSAVADVVQDAAPAPAGPPARARHLRIDPVIAEYHPAPSAPLARPANATATPLTAAAPQMAETLPPLGSAPRTPRIAAVAPPPIWQGKGRVLVIGAIAACFALAGVFTWSLIETLSDPTDTETVASSAATPDIATAVVALPSETTPEATPGVAVIAPTDIIENAFAPSVPAVTAIALSAPKPLENNGPVPAPEAAMAALQLPAPIAMPDIADPQPDVATASPPAPVETAQAAIGAPVLRGRVLSPDEAARIYAATGVWQRAPRMIDVPRTTSLDRMTRTSNAPAPDRLSQPQVPDGDEMGPDLSFLSPVSPPSPDVIFAVDESGQILATQEGTATPDGAMVFAGLPDFNVQTRPELTQAQLDLMAALAPAPEGVVILPGPPIVQPPLRPEGLAPEVIPTEDAPATDATPGAVALAALQPDAPSSAPSDSDPSLAGLQSQTDPTPIIPPSDLPSNPDITSVIAMITDTAPPETSLTDATSQAVGASQRPEPRPGNFARVVASALEQQRAAPQVAPTVAPATTPIPTYAPLPGGVARAATIEEAISLREINLIGVYGRPNNRRALVRLSNGRYIRVEIGSTLDGGQVTAISDNALNYVKRGRTYLLQVPSG